MSAAFNLKDLVDEVAASASPLHGGVDVGNVADVLAALRYEAATPTERQHRRQVLSDRQKAAALAWLIERVVDSEQDSALRKALDRE